MWSIEKFGAVGSLGRAATSRPPIFLNPTCHSVSDEPFILSDFGAEPRPSYAPLLRKCAKLNRQTPIYRNHSKSRKTNNHDLLKSPKNQILQHRNLPACGLILTLENLRFLSSLTGSGSQTEIAVTYSKQRTAQLLTGSRIAHKHSSTQSKFSPELVHGAPVAPDGPRLSLATSHSLLAAALRYNAPAQTSPARLAT
jgi:hypothetical protein